MNELKEVELPDIGDFNDVDVIEVLVAPGDTVSIDDPLITIETDKASMEIPAPYAGLVEEVVVRTGDKVSRGSLLLKMDLSAEAEDNSSTNTASAANTTRADQTDPSALTAGVSEQVFPEPATAFSGEVSIRTDVLVLGSGPGGYTAAFRAADLGKGVVLVERYATIGGVCLNVGCIPSKALLHAARLVDEAEDFSDHGIRFGAPDIDLDKLRGWKNSVVNKLTGGLTGLAKQRKVDVVQGTGRFLDSNHLEVEDSSGSKSVIRFDYCIIAAGSASVRLPFMPDDPRVVDSTGALELHDIPDRLLVLGGGIIGLEMATVYHALGSKVSVVEMLPELMAGADQDIVRPFYKRIKKRYENIWLETRVTGVEAQNAGLKVDFDGKNAPPESQLFDRILVSVGRVPNGKILDADKAGVAVDKHGFISVDKQQRTNVEHIFAIGDIVGQPMLAHKATHEGKIAAEVCAGMRSYFDAKVIPSVAYTDPEVAWVGVTEREAKETGMQVTKSVFPWAASGRSLSNARDEGITKLIFSDETGRLVGAGIVGNQAGDLIAETALAIEMNCEAADIGLTVHPHPTLSETIAMAAEVFEGTITDLYLPKKKSR